MRQFSKKGGGGGENYKWVKDHNITIIKKWFTRYARFQLVVDMIFNLYVLQKVKSMGEKQQEL